MCSSRQHRVLLGSLLGNLPRSQAAMWLEVLVLMRRFVHTHYFILFSFTVMQQVILSCTNLVTLDGPENDKLVKVEF